MIGTLGIPVLNRGDLLMRCVLSVDHPVEHLLIINNGNDEGVIRTAQQIMERQIENEACFENIRVEKHRNLGCGPSWNYIMKNSPGPWLLVGSDVKLLPGSLGLLDATLEKNPDAGIICGNGYNAFLMTESGLKTAGYLDENFYPAYFEDCDHFRRVALSGTKAVGVPGFQIIHGEAPNWGSSTVKSDANYNKKNGITYQSNQGYYVKKWGGLPGKETFKTPFNKDVPMTWWELDPEMRKKNDVWNT